MQVDGHTFYGFRSFFIFIIQANYFKNQNNIHRKYLHLAPLFRWNINYDSF